VPRKCSICGHAKLEEINAALIESRNITEIAKRFAVSHDALLRHRQSHIPAGLTKAHEAQESAKADTLLHQVVSLRDTALRILVQAERAGDLRAALQGIKEARGCLELLARLQGELQQQTLIQVGVLVQSPEWTGLRAAIVSALEPFPEARQAVAAAITKQEATRHGQQTYIPGR
jgi:hypothetical protein